LQVLLRSDKGVANFSDRTLLKNLGHWLGMITLAKNKPILKIVSTAFLWITLQRIILSVSPDVLYVRDIRHRAYILKQSQNCLYCSFVDHPPPYHLVVLHELVC
jgi:hypothetical protein